MVGAITVGKNSNHGNSWKPVLQNFFFHFLFIDDSYFSDGTFPGTDALKISHLIKRGYVSKSVGGWELFMKTILLARS
jgi:hypothetical protein